MPMPADPIEDTMSEMAFRTKGLTERRAFSSPTWAPATRSRLRQLERRRRAHALDASEGGAGPASWLASPHATAQSLLAGKAGSSWAVAFLVTNVKDLNDVLHGHVSLEIDCADRGLVDACVPDLEVAGGRLTTLDRQEVIHAGAETALATMRGPLGRTCSPQKQRRR
jgi:hypothetical protein